MKIKIKELAYNSGKKERRCFIELEHDGRTIHIDMLITDYDISCLPSAEYIKMKKWQERKRQDAIVAQESLYEGAWSI